MRSFRAAFLTPTGGVVLGGSLLLALAVAIDRLRWLAVPAVALLAVTIVREAYKSHHRTKELTDELRATRQDLVEQIDENRRTARQLREALDEQQRAGTRRLERLELELDQKLEKTIAATERSVRGDLAEQVEIVRDRITSAIESERSRRSLSIARMTDPHRSVRKVLLLMTIHRSGSTRLFDIFRTHPAVRVEPTADLWRSLGLRGRRYPVAFSDLPRSWRAIEIEDGVGATIDEIDVAPLAVDPNEWWALEKAHPEFTDFDVDRWVERIGELRSTGVEVEVVYGVRRLLDAMWSMASFKERQPTWYARVEPGAVPAWIARSLESIREMHAAVPGRIVDYRDLPGGAVIADLGRRLAPRWSDVEVAEWLGFADAATRPERPQQSGSGFLGERAADPDPDPDGPGGIWVDVGAELTAADAAYDELMG